MAKSTVTALASAGDANVLSREMALPPGLEPPPGLSLFFDVSKDHAQAVGEPAHEAQQGLEQELPLPPGLSLPGKSIPAQAPNSVDDSAIKVSIKGIPDKLLSEAVVEVMLDQLGCDNSMIRFTITRGKPSGYVSVFFSTAMSAQQCVHHFHGRKWGASGNPVQAEISHMPTMSNIEPLEKTTRAAQVTSFMPSQHCKPVKVRTPTKRLPITSKPQHQVKELSADAPVFQPSFTLSADTPAYVPVFDLKELTSLISKQLGANSETSTELGESGSEDGR